MSFAGVCVLGLAVLALVGVVGDGGPPLRGCQRPTGAAELLPRGADGADAVGLSLRAVLLRVLVDRGALLGRELLEVRVL